MHEEIGKDMCLPEAVLNASDASIQLTRDVCAAVLRLIGGEKRFDELRKILTGHIADLAQMKAENDQIRQTWIYVPGASISRSIQ